MEKNETDFYKEDITIDYLKRKDSLFGIVLDSIFNGLYIARQNGEIIFWNDGAIEITGYSLEEVMGEKCSDNILVHQDENGNKLCGTKNCPIYRVFNYGFADPVKVYTLHKTGKRFPALTHMAPVKNKRGETIAAVEIFRDISKEEELRLLQEKFNDTIKKYVSNATYDEVVKKIQSPGEHHEEACEREVTVLYLDIAGFTKFSEIHTPREVIRMLNDIFGLCEVITKEYHGDIDKFIGDCVMATFISPDDSIKAAIKILKALERYNRFGEGKETSIHVRIGINTGKVLQGEIGTKDRKDLTVIGDTVNTASRIESATPPDSIFISSSTYQRLSLENSKLFRFHSKIAVKGKAEPIMIFKVVNNPSAEDRGACGFPRRPG
ncbi:adenylate/guanylate cyclase domain-containing protein [Desulfobacterales bacterium HSG16]|nr:adenylate/guanylate cyclase domain-containing protein [Desulfobacterales bacterium HSG16]